MSVSEMIEEVEAIELDELRDAATRLLADKVDRRAGWNGGTVDAAALDGAMAELGWPLLTIPAARDGLGQRFTALAPIYEEMGRALAPTSFAATMAAVDVLVQDAGDAANVMLGRIGSGEARLIVGCADAVDGRATLELVPDASAATDLLLIPVQDGEPVRLIGLSEADVRRADVWDRTRDFADVSVTLDQAAVLDVDAAIARQIARAHLDLALAWDSIGAAQQSLTETVAYMGTRNQFGRPIGSFQALKHRAADHRVAIDVAHALVGHATAAFAARSSGWDHLAGQARLLAVDAFRNVAEDSIQLHGGIGFTWEHDCHLFLKRALMNEVLRETQDVVRDRIAPAIMTRALAER